MTDAVIDLLANTEAIAVNQQIYKHPVGGETAAFSSFSADLNIR
jgi:hypothetical protein